MGCDVVRAAELAQADAREAGVGGQAAGALVRRAPAVRAGGRAVAGADEGCRGRAWRVVMEEWAGVVV